jgi:hypothetical protein
MLAPAPRTTAIEKKKTQKGATRKTLEVRRPDRQAVHRSEYPLPGPRMCLFAGVNLHGDGKGRRCGILVSHYYYFMLKIDIIYSCWDIDFLVTLVDKSLSQNL